ncbi:MAG: hypothetical protein NTZ33_14415 [Bacteroidetes bacterium]|nr:hypothetical protein [Bacteroidota bacterium]
MKEKILKYFTEDRSFDGAVKIYMEHGNSMGIKNTINRQGYSEYNHKLLHEQFKEMAGIDQAEMESLLSLPIGKQIPAKEKKIAVVGNTPAVMNIMAIPEEIKKTIRLREDFPFLGNADCPNELKILVADRITAYHKYVEAHKALFDAASPEEIAELSAAVIDNYIENQEIWAELTHYKETGEVLGAHPIFAEQKRKAEIIGMTTGDQIKLLNNLNNYVARSTKEITDNPEADNDEKIFKIKQWKFELDILADILKVQPKKTKETTPAPAPAKAVVKPTSKNKNTADKKGKTKVKK